MLNDKSLWYAGSRHYKTQYVLGKYLFYISVIFESPYKRAFMLPRENKTVIIEELKPLLKGGATWSSLFRIMYYTRQYRYIKYEFLDAFNPP